jgi:hypothetical protein
MNRKPKRIFHVEKLVHNTEDGATFKQRSALFNLHSALGWDLKGIRDLTKSQAGAKIEYALQYIKDKGFPKWSIQERLNNSSRTTDQILNDFLDDN